MQYTKKKCHICGDTILGPAYKVLLRYGYKNRVTVDTGCLFLLEKKNLILTPPEKWKN